MMKNENNVCQFVADAESGRSMVEMLGTLAIMGVLSAGAIGGYSYAMNKHRTNELIYEATKRAQWVGTQLELGSDPSLNTFGADSFGFGSFSGIDNNLPNANQFGIKVADLKKGVCDNLVNHLERTGVIRDVTNVDCNAGTATLVFNRDLSTSDSEITPDEPEVSGEASASAGAVSEPATQDPDEVHCSGNGSWDGSSCYCDPDWGGDDCSEHNDEPESSERATPVTINNEPVITTTAQSGDAECNYRGTWYRMSNGAGGCSCNAGWGGSDCSEDHRNDCSGHGSWSQSYNNGAGGCSCNSGWGGSDCSEDHRNDCSGHGYWNQSQNSGAGECSCDPGWGGSDCSDGSARESCSNHGYLNGTTCYCDSGWGGSDCSQTTRAACNNHGTWNGWGCVCDPGYGGRDASGKADCSMTEAEFCNGRGTLNAEPTCCTCNSGWYGARCDFSDARSACNNHGSWQWCGCTCDPGWGGNDCSIENACSGHGTWYGYLNNGAGGCSCDRGWGGDDCSQGNEATTTRPPVTTR